MCAFIGGSAFVMAKDIADGLVLLTPMLVRKLNKPEIQNLEFELNKLLKEVRGEQPPLTDTLAIQKRNRKMSRINQAAIIIRNLESQRR